MKIAYLCADRGVPLLGHKGASVHVRSVAAALVGRGHEVVLGCRTLGSGNPPPLGVRIEVMPPDEKDHETWLKRLLADTGAEAVLERHSLSSGPALEVTRSLGVTLAVEVNAPLVEEAARYRGLQDVERWRSWEGDVLRRADRLIAVSSAIRDHAVAQGVEADRVVVIPNGVDRGMFAGTDALRAQARHQHGFGDEDVVVGFAGSLRPWHGAALLVQAMRALPSSVRLLLVGDGPQREELQGAASGAGLGGRVTFTGAVAHAEIPTLLAAMDVGAAPYTTQAVFYFSPLKVAEYLAAGLPVVGTDQGELAELVGDAGLLVRPDDAGALAGALDVLVSDASRRARMSDAARQQAAELDWDRVAAKVEAVLLHRGVPA